ncbi:MAG: hypothetical protein LBQ60_11425 [Bacteroidales bacterium]|jgi:hypothetical protein|nr:hypothetical protein [Bacteroidales bacterium]
MRLKTIFSLCISIIIHHAYTQNIQGVVCDRKTKKFVTEVYVFLNDALSPKSVSISGFDS